MGGAHETPDRLRSAEALPTDLEATDLAVTVVRARDAVWVDVSDAFCDLVGHSRDELIGRTPVALGMSDPKRLAWLIERFPARGAGYAHVRVFETPHGPRLTRMHLHGVEIGGERYVIAVMHELREDAAHPDDIDILGAMMDGAPVGVVVYDRDLRIIRINRAVEEMGRIGPQHIGMRVTEVFKGVDPGLIDGIGEVIDSGRPAVNLYLSSSDERSFLVNLFPIRRPDGEVIQVGCIFSDVTERIAAERALVESEAHRRQILLTLLQAEEAERSRIATELHDDTVQVMTAVLLSMDRVAIAARKTGQEAIERAVMLARSTLEEATDRARRLMFELRPAILYERGLLPALGMLADQTARETGAVAEVRAHVGRHEREIEELVYRTVQEALSNVRKHAAPTRITVTVKDAGGTLSGEIVDDGQGFDVARAKARPRAALHLGLDSLEERLRALGGEIEVESAPGAGTRLRFSLPFADRPGP